MKTRMLILGLLICSQFIFGQNQVVWNKDLNHYEFKVSGNKIFILMDKKMEAHEEGSFNLIWDTPTSPSLFMYDLQVDSEHVFACGYDKDANQRYVCAFDAKTGGPLWQFKWPESKVSDIHYAGISHGMILFYADKKLLGLDLVSGKQTLSIKAEGIGIGFYTKGYDDNIYVAQVKETKDNSKFKRWTSVYDYKGKQVMESLMIGDTSFILRAATDKIWILYSGIGSDKRDANFGEPIPYPYITDKIRKHVLWKGKLDVTYKPMGDKILEIGNSSVCLMDIWTGKQTWKYESKDTLVDAKLADDNSVIACMKAGNIIKFDGKTGQLIWNKKFPREIESFDLVGQNLYVSIGYRRFAWSSAQGRNIMSLDISKMNRAVVSNLSTISNQKAEIRVQSGHKGNVNSVAVSSDGKRIISASNDHTLKLWDIETGKEMTTFKGHANKVDAVAFSFDGRKVVSGDVDNTIKLWDTETGKPIMSLKGRDVNVDAVAFSPTEEKFISAENLGSLELWDAQTGKVLWSVKGESKVNSVAFSADGQRIVSGDGSFSEQGKIKIWDTQTGREIKSLIGHTSPVVSVAFSPDGSKIISGGGKMEKLGEIKLWDAETGKEIRSFTGHKDVVNSVAFSPDGQTVISASDDGTIKLWDVETGKEIKSYLGHKGQVTSIAFTPDGMRVVSGSRDNTLKLWDVDAGKEIRSFVGRVDFGWSAAISADGTKFISAKSDKTLKLWDIKTGKLINSFAGHTDKVTSVAFSPDGKRFVSGSQDKTLKLWDIETGKEIKSFVGHNAEVTAVAFSSDGKKIASGAGSLILNQGEIKIWDAETGKEIASFAGLTQQVYSIAFSPDGKKVISGSEDNTLKLWDIATGQNIRSFVGHTFKVTACSFSSDGKEIISGGGDGKLMLWDAETGKVISSFTGHTDWISSVSFSHDGTRIISGSWDESVKLWDVATGKEMRSFIGHGANVTSALFASDGKRIVSEGDDGTVRIWNLETGEEIAKLISYSDGEWLIVTPDGYFDCSKNGGELVAMVQGLNCWNIDQFAVKNNRPDIILQRLGSDNKELIAHYNAQYQKRLRKLGLTEDQLSNDYYVPTTSIVETKQNDKTVNLKFNLHDERFSLKRYNIYVNDVPIFGSYGKEVSGKNVDLNENIELISGANKIEISCMNEKGVESYRALSYTKYDKPVVGNLYYIGFGVSKYLNPNLNLRYADKDASNLADVLGKMKGNYSNVYINTFVNEQVTVENITKAKELLKNAKPDDTFILFIAGHGMHDNDKEATYYYLTHNADPNDLKNTACNFETIEDLLQGVAPRNKLFLMDACESGEIDDEDQDQMLAAATGAGISSRGFKSIGVKVTSNQQPVTKRSYLYQKDRYIYNDLARRSGAIVFSSSKGDEFSYERSDIQNGLFTKSIINALTTNAADKNNDGIVSTDELREFVSAEVAKTSNDLQHPTVDRDNIYQKFGFKIK